MVWTLNPVKQWRHARFVQRRVAERSRGIRDTVRSAPAGCVVLAGNSHAEFLETPDFAGRSCINLGIGGSTAEDCARHLAGLRPPPCPASVVLFVGTNDILRWRRPDRKRTADRFADATADILEILGAWTPQVFVAAVPPIGAWATSRDPAAVATFSDRLETLCRRRGHTFFDPFAAIRDGTGGLALGGLHRDGVHLSDYPGLAAEVVGFVGPRSVLSTVAATRTVATSAMSIERRAAPAPGRSFSAAVRAAAHPRRTPAAPMGRP